MVGEHFKFEHTPNPLEGLKENKDSKEKLQEKRTKIQEQDAVARKNLLKEIPTSVKPEDKEAQKKIIEAEMKVEDLKNLTVDQLLALEHERPGILLFAFTTWGDQHAQRSIKDFEHYDQPKQGDQFQIDFRGNQEAYWKIGANDILPPEVRCITVADKDGNKRTSLRRVGLKSEKREAGFYDDEGYIPIFTGDLVIVGGEKSPQERGVDPSVRQKYFDEKNRTWNEAAYEKDNAEADRRFFEHYFKTSDTEAISSRIKIKSKLTPAQSKDIREVLKTPERQNWLTTMTDAIAHFREKTGVSIRPSVIFAFIRHESNFMPGVPNEGSKQEKQSTALGLGQFIEGTWLKFVRENRDVVRKINGRVPFNKNGKLALRTNPELSIYAMTWYVANLAKGVGLRDVTPKNAGEIYLRYHQGEGGAETVKSYFRYRKLGKSPQEAGQSVRLYKFQKDKADRGELESYFQWIQSTSETVASTARKYDDQLSEI